MHYFLLPVLLVLAPLAVAQPDEHDYSRTTYTASAAFIYAQPEDGRVLEMVPEGAIVGVDVCLPGRTSGDEWCPVQYKGVTGYAPRDALRSVPSIPAPVDRRRSMANPRVYDAPARPERPSSTPVPSIAGSEAPALDTTGATFVGSKRSQVFHRASCSHVARIAAHNLVAYESAADAESQGKRPCRACHPADD